MNDIIQAVLAHATEVQPNECCGLVVERDGVQQYVRCENIASNPQERFVIAPEDYAEAEDEGEIVMIAHSHVFINPEPSEADRSGCEASSLPWLIVNYPLGTHTLTYPSGFKAPLIGRQFCKGTQDCYALVRDWFAQEKGVELPDYVRPETWVEDGNSILVDNFKAFGFEEITLSEMQEGDCILFQVAATIPNHCAVYIGNNQIMHQVLDRLSSRDVSGEFWRKTSRHYLRYVGVPA